MSRGYLTIALNNADADYVEMAYCQAMSLRLNQSQVSNLSVIVDKGQEISPKQRAAFDRVIELPEDLSNSSQWRVHNYCQIYELSPYDETVFVAADVLFVGDVSEWWSVMCKREVQGTLQILNYRGEPIKYNPLRTDFSRIGLPDIHNGLFYFRKGALASRLFGRMRQLTENWWSTVARHFGRKDVHYSGDCAILLSIREEGLEEYMTEVEDPSVPTFVHMKPCMQGWESATDKDWRKYVSHVLTGQRLFVGDYEIRAPFHFYVKNFITPDVVRLYEHLLACQS